MNSSVKKKILVRILKHKYLFLLSALVGVIIITPLVVTMPITRMVLYTLYTATLTASIYEMRRTKSALIIASLLALASIITQPSYLIYRTLFTQSLNALFAMGFLLFISVVIFHDVIRGEKSLKEQIYGALCLYILMGVCFGNLYTLIENIWPGSFQDQGLALSLDYFESWFSLVYFSISTLTTVGLSSLVVINPIAKSFIIIEELLGVLYLAALVGRLVAEWSVHGDKK